MNHDELRALADAALTQSGNWFPAADVAFIRAASPDRIIALLDELDSLVDDLHRGTRHHEIGTEPGCDWCQRYLAAVVVPA